jgi:hypothetical protein
MMTKLSGVSAFLLSTTLSAAALGAGADDPAHRFIDRIAGEGSYSAVSSPSIAGDRTSDPARSFLERLAGIQTPAPEPAGTVDPGDPARDFVDRLAGVPTVSTQKDVRIVDTSASHFISADPRAPAGRE